MGKKTGDKKADASAKKIADLESRVAALETEMSANVKNTNKALDSVEAVFKNCKRYIDDANKAQDKKIAELAKKVGKKK